MRAIRFLAVAAVLVGLVGPAMAQMDSREGIALQNQILELRRDLGLLRDQIAAGGAATPRYRNEAVPNQAPNDLVTSLLERVSRLEDAVRELQGRVDEATNRLQRQGDDFTKQIGDLNFRLQTLEGGGAPGRGAAMSPPPTNLVPPPAAGGPATGFLGVPSGPLPMSPSEPPQPPRTPETAMQQGNAALARRDYAAAEAVAHEVLTIRGPRAYDAQFLLAQALMGERQFQQAAIAYDDAYNRARTGAHAQDALLGLASSLAAINERRSACETLLRLRAEFPQPRPDVRDQAIVLRQRVGCP